MVDPCSENTLRTPGNFNTPRWVAWELLFEVPKPTSRIHGNGCQCKECRSRTIDFWSWGSMQRNLKCFGYCEGVRLSCFFPRMTGYANQLRNWFNDAWFSFPSHQESGANAYPHSLRIGRTTEKRTNASRDFMRAAGLVKTLDTCNPWLGSQRLMHIPLLSIWV